MVLLFENGAQFVVASLGVLKAANIQVPLESTFPRPRLSFMLEQSEAGIVIADCHHLELAQNPGLSPHWPFSIPQACRATRAFFSHANGGQLGYMLSFAIEDVVRRR